MSVNVIPWELHVNSWPLCSIWRKSNTEPNKIGYHFFSEALKVISGVLKVMTLKTHGDFWKRLYFKVI